MSTGDDPPSKPPEDPAAPPPAPVEEPVAIAPYEVAPATEPQPMLAAPPATDEPILPTTYDEHALQDAVGAKRRRKPKAKPEPLDEDGLPDEKKRNRKMIVIASLAAVVGLAIAAFVIFGRMNAQRYHLDCTTTEAIAEQGRSFPPWGYSRLPGAEWKAVALPPNAQCKSEELDDIKQLEARMLDLLLERTSATLTTRNFLDVPAVADGKPVASPLDVLTMQLEQALLLSRSPERGDQRKQVERLQGDVQYWRASLRLRDATAALSDAARQFDQASLARPMHVSDAGSWAEFLRRLAEELQAGPNGLPAGFPPAPTGAPSTAPTGTALPVEPPAAGSDAPPPTPDAGVPTGGVLL